MKKLNIITCLVCTLSASAYAQTCKVESITPSQITAGYLDNKDGTVTDIVNGRVWTKCSLGETYDTTLNTCSGTPANIETWSEALTLASNSSEMLNLSGWRLPNITELRTLVERSCVAPSINLSVFPSTPSAVYWSNTFDKENINPISGVNGLVVDFSDGTEFVTDVNRHRLIRLIRDPS